MNNNKLPRHFHQSDGKGFMYDTAAEAAEALLERPDQIRGYIEGMYNLASGVAAWGAYEDMRDTLNLLVDVLIEIDKQRRAALEAKNGD